MRVLVSGPSKWNKKASQNPGRADAARAWLDAELHNLSIQAAKQQDHVEVGSSLHLGLDTTFAMIAQERELPYTTIIACDEQDRYWDEDKKRTFKSLLSQAGRVEKICEKHYEPGCIGKQSTSLTDWLLEDEAPTLLLLKDRKLSKLQQERVSRVKEAGGEIKLFRW